MSLSAALALVLCAAPDAPATPLFDVPGASALVRLPAGIDDSGRPQQLWAAKSSQSVATLARQLTQAMVRAGLFVAPAAEQVQFEGAFQLTGIDLRTLAAHTVLVFAEARGASVVYGLTRLDLAPAQPVGVPLPPGARPLGTFSSEGFVTVLFESPGDAPAVRRFFESPGAGGLELKLVPSSQAGVRGAVRWRR